MRIGKTRLTIDARALMRVLWPTLVTAPCVFLLFAAGGHGWSGLIWATALLGFGLAVAFLDALWALVIYVQKRLVPPRFWLFD